MADTARGADIYFNSRPHGGRPLLLFLPTPGQNISTHALTEGDGYLLDIDALKNLFQLTPSRRATLPFNFVINSVAFQLTPSRRATANLDKFFF